MSQGGSGHFRGGSRGLSGDRYMSSPPVPPREEDAGAIFRERFVSDVKEEDALQLMLDLYKVNSAFKEMEQTDMVAMSRTVSVLRFKPQEIAIEAGEPATFFAIILQGVFQVKLPNGKHVDLPAGTLLGEISFFEGSRRTADVTAKTHSLLAVITFQELEDLRTVDPVLRLKIINIFATEGIRKLRERNFQSAQKKQENKDSLDQTETDDGQGTEEHLEALYRKRHLITEKRRIAVNNHGRTGSRSRPDSQSGDGIYNVQTEETKLLKAQEMKLKSLHVMSMKLRNKVRTLEAENKDKTELIERLQKQQQDTEARLVRRIKDGRSDQEDLRFQLQKEQHDREKLVEQHRLKLEREREKMETHHTNVTLRLRSDLQVEIAKRERLVAELKAERTARDAARKQHQAQVTKFTTDAASQRDEISRLKKTLHRREEVIRQQTVALEKIGELRRQLTEANTRAQRERADNEQLRSEAEWSAREWEAFRDTMTRENGKLTRDLEFTRRDEASYKVLLKFLVIHHYARHFLTRKALRKVLNWVKLLLARASVHKIQCCPESWGSVQSKTVPEWQKEITKVQADLESSQYFTDWRSALRKLESEGARPFLFPKACPTKPKPAAQPYKYRNQYTSDSPLVTMRNKQREQQRKQSVEEEHKSSVQYSPISSQPRSHQLSNSVGSAAVSADMEQPGDEITSDEDGSPNVFVSRDNMGGNDISAGDSGQNGQDSGGSGLFNNNNGGNDGVNGGEGSGLFSNNNGAGGFDGSSGGSGLFNNNSGNGGSGFSGGGGSGLFSNNNASSGLFSNNNVSSGLFSSGAPPPPPPSPPKDEDVYNYDDTEWNDEAEPADKAGVAEYGQDDWEADQPEPEQAQGETNVGNKQNQPDTDEEREGGQPDTETEAYSPHDTVRREPTVRVNAEKYEQIHKRQRSGYTPFSTATEEQRKHVAQEVGYKRARAQFANRARRREELNKSHSEDLHRRLESDKVKFISTGRSRYRNLEAGANREVYRHKFMSMLDTASAVCVYTSALFGVVSDVCAMAHYWKDTSKSFFERVVALTGYTMRLEEALQGSKDRRAALIKRFKRVQQRSQALETKLDLAKQMMATQGYGGSLPVMNSGMTPSVSGRQGSVSASSHHSGLLPALHDPVDAKNAQLPTPQQSSLLRSGPRGNEIAGSPQEDLEMAELKEAEDELLAETRHHMFSQYGGLDEEPETTVSGGAGNTGETEQDRQVMEKLVNTMKMDSQKRWERSQQRFRDNPRTGGRSGKGGGLSSRRNVHPTARRTPSRGSAPTASAAPERSSEVQRTLLPEVNSPRSAVSPYVTGAAELRKLRTKLSAHQRRRLNMFKKGQVQRSQWRTRLQEVEEQERERERRVAARKQESLRARQRMREDYRQYHQAKRRGASPTRSASPTKHRVQPKTRAQASAQSPSAPETAARTDLPMLSEVETTPVDGVVATPDADDSGDPPPVDAPPAVTAEEEEYGEW